MKLTIGIPTYNRCNVITDALDSVMSQVSAVDDVDVLVVDNASTDGTADVVQMYRDRFADKISYRKNESNIGFAANVDTVVKASEGEYVLILSDDDALEPGTVKYVLDMLNLYKVAVLFLRAGHGTVSCRHHYGIGLVYKCRAAKSTRMDRSMCQGNGLFLRAAFRGML